MRVFESIKKNAKSLAVDLMIVAGFSSVTAGAWVLSFAAGLIVAGLSLLCIAVFIGWGGAR